MCKNFQSGRIEEQNIKFKTFHILLKLCRLEMANEVHVEIDFLNFKVKISEKHTIQFRNTYIHAYINVYIKFLV